MPLQPSPPSRFATALHWVIDGSVERFTLNCADWTREEARADAADLLLLLEVGLRQGGTLAPTFATWAENVREAFAEAHPE